MSFDHSSTYKIFKFRNIPHMLRLRHIRRALKEFQFQNTQYGDFGCSNGFITEIVYKEIRPKKAFGFDFSENIKEAKERYPHINFHHLNLNDENSKIPLKLDFITCFETLEHVGRIDVALEVIVTSLNQNGLAILTVPIETGLWGAVKFFYKIVLKKEETGLSCSNYQYFRRLINKKCLDVFREPADGYSPHFGFDYRVIRNQLARMEALKQLKILDEYSISSTQFFIFRKT